MTNEHRDDTIDRLLSALQPQSRSVSSSACLEPEVLAAWIDSGLQDSARANAEAHVASCSRCQALLAAMARTAEAAAGSAIPIEQPRSTVFRLAPWIAALGTAAVAVVIWIGVLPQSGERVAPSPASSVQQNEAARLETPKESAPPTPADQPESERRAFIDAVEKSATPAAAGRPRRDTADTAGKTSAPQQSKDEAVARQESKIRVDDRAAAPSAKAIEGIGASAPSTLPGKPIAGAATLPPPAAPATLPAPVPLLPKPVNERVQEPQRTSELRRTAALQDQVSIAGQMAPSSIAISSPVSKIAWRILNRTVVQLSIDGGATWTTQRTGVESALNAGSAPSATVCWLVGAGGTVLLTLDSGRTWQHVQFPEQIDLVRVVSTSAEHAVVTAVDGRSFSTTDRGQTWR